MLTRELLNELKLFENIKGREWLFRIEGNIIDITYNINTCFDGNKMSINIYEIAHKCKEFAHTKKLSLSSFNGYGGWFCKVMSWNDSTFKSREFKADTEIEAIFKAMSFIMGLNK